MEKIKFITDSSSDLTRELAEEFDIEIVPMGIIMGGNYYNEGKDFTSEEFYDLMATHKKLPTTSAINPNTWYEVMEKQGLESENDRLVIVTVGAKLSSSYDAAIAAKEQFLKNHSDCKVEIDIYDSRTASAGYGYPITEAVKKLRRGIDYKEIITYFDDWFHSLEVYLVIFSLEVAKKSGRINAPMAFIGEVLNIRPIMQCIDGVFTPYTKARGDGLVPKKLLEIVKTRMREKSDYILLNGTQPNACDSICALMKETLGYAESAIYKPGPAMVVNGGPAMLCLGFLGDRRGE